MRGRRSRAQEQGRTSERDPTIALAGWLAGEDPHAARDAGAETWLSETWLFYGELAAHRTASLNEVITHCLCWRDAVAEVLQQSASQMDVSSEALSQALHMPQLGLEFGFIQLGVRIAIDDFGTGYSSFVHLQQFPVDELKIDRSFVSGLTGSREGETLIHTLVQLGKALSIETLAEGIEEPQELSVLQNEECDTGQGFLFARPLDADAVDAFLQTWPEGASSGSPRAPRTGGHAVIAQRS